MKKKLLVVTTGLLCSLFSTKGIAQVPTASFSLSQSTVCVGETVQITDLSSDSPSSWSYTLGSTSDLSSVQDPSVSFSAPGMYVIQLEATNGSGTSAVYSETLTVSGLPVIAISGNTAVCEGASASFTASGASSYAWSNGAVTPDNVSGNIYSNSAFTATGTSSDGCVNTATFDVVVNALPVVSGMATSTVVCQGDQITLNGAGADTYTWSAGATEGVAFAPSASGSYNVSGTNTLTGCTSTNVASVMITVNPLPVISVVDFSICSGSSVTLAPTGASTYTFSNGSAVIAPTTNTTISVTGTSADGCVSSGAATSNITVNASPVISVNSGAICAGSTFVISPSGASTYTISGGSATVSPIANTSYSVSGTSAAGCLSSNSAVSDVTVNPLPTVSVTSSNATICAGSSATLTANGAVSYTWNASTTSGSLVVSPSANSTYSVRGTSSQGCVSSDAVSSINVNALPVISANSGSVCPGGTFAIAPTGALTYSFTNGSTVLTGTSVVVSPSANSNYTVSGIDANGCVSSGTNSGISSITALASPTLTVTSNPASVCPGVTASLTVSGANSYTWASSSATSSLITVSPMATTVYSVSGTGTNVCNGINTFTLNVYPAPTVTVNSGAICSGYNFTLTGSGASTYTFSNASGTVSSVVSPVAATSYSVIGTSAQGCISNTLTPAVSNVVVNASPTLSAVGGTVCSGLSYSIMPAGANTYSLNSVATTSVAAVTPVANTTYTVTGSGANGCVSPVPAVVTVSVIANPTLATAASASAICAGQATAVIAASGANTYTWNTSANTSSISVAPSVTTIYTVSGTSALGCNGSQTVAVVVNPLPIITAAASKTFICVGDASILSATGANTYTWTTGSNSSSVSVNPITNTTYTVAGTDLSGCVNMAVRSVLVNTTNITVSSNATVCLGSEAVLSASGANTYTWNGSFPFQSFSVSPVALTVYTVSGTDANNCVLSKTVSVDVYQLPVLTTSISSTVICTGESATVEVSGNASSYVWSTGTSTSTGLSIVVSPTINLLFTYSVTGTDGNNCSSTATRTLSVSECTGLKNVAANAVNVSVYPNPGNGEFTITSDSRVEAIVINSIGQVVGVYQLQSGDNKVDLKEQNSGIYFIQIAGPVQNKTIKVVKN